MSNMKNFGGFLDNYIKKYGNTAEQDKHVTGLINAKGHKINTYIYAKKPTSYYCYRIGAIIDDDSVVNSTGDFLKRDRLIEISISIPYAFEGKKIRTKPTFAIIVSKTMFTWGFKMDRSQFDSFMEFGDSILYKKNLDQIKDAVFYMEYVDKLVKNFTDIINAKEYLKYTD